MNDNMMNFNLAKTIIIQYTKIDKKNQISTISFFKVIYTYYLRLKSIVCYYDCGFTDNFFYELLILYFSLVYQHS